MSRRDSISQESELAFERNTKPHLPLFSALNRSKLDKAQAKKLKMPKRNRSAYFLYSIDIRAKLRAEQTSRFTPLQTQAFVSQSWRNLSSEEKERYEQKAREEKKEYLVAIDKFYSSLTPETIEKSKTNKPKKPCSAYAHFVRDLKTELKKKNPRLIMQEILRIASDKWKSLPEETRIGYEEKARKDKEQYMALIERLNLEAQLEAQGRKSDIYGASILGKRPYKIEESDKEDKITKYIKVEDFSVKSEREEEENSSPTKLEDYKALSNVSYRPLFQQLSYDLHQSLASKCQVNYLHRSEPSQAPMLFANSNTWPVNQTILSLPHPNQPFSQQINHRVNAVSNVYFQEFAEQTRQSMLTNLSLIKMIQNQQDLEQTILKKLTEVKDLQFQRMKLNRELLLATTQTGGF